MPVRQLDNWLDGYMFYTQESECPDSFLIWSGLHTLSAAIQRKTWVPWVYSDFFPNIYIMLVGPPGVTHKNSAIRFSKLALRAVGVPLSSEAISKEALIQQMTRRGKDRDALAVMSSEFATFLRTSGASMVEFITDIFDCEDDFEYTTKGGGTARIPRPYLTMFTGATPGWLSEEFDVSFIEGGFSARTLFVAETAPRFRKAFAHITSEMRGVYKKVLQDLEVIAELDGEFQWTPDATSWFEQWYENILPSQDIDYRLRGYLGRKPTHLLKVSQLLCVNQRHVQDSDDLVITPKIMGKALKHIEAIEPNMVQAFRAVGRNPFANDHERIAHEITQAGGMSHSEILTKNTHALNRMQLDEILQNLSDMEVIQQVLKGGKKWYLALEREDE